MIFMRPIKYGKHTVGEIINKVLPRFDHFDPKITIFELKQFIL